jgi:hypothetical protein
MRGALRATSPVGPAGDPRAAVLARVATRLRQLRPGGAPAIREAVRDLVVIGSSSRGGSSIFAEVLRRHPGLLHFRAEINPFLVLAGRTHPESGVGSDALGPEHAEGFDATDLARDCGIPLATLETDADRERFAVDLACRLTMQWPEDRFALDEVHATLDAALGRLEREFGWSPGDFPDASLFHAVFLAELRRTHPSVNPWYYDLDPALVRDLCPDAVPSDRAPSSVIIEEPPFVTIRPWRPATAAELATRPLVVKTPGNAYRMEFLAALFPNARIRLLHLTRNVAASVNGLYDGWRFDGFHAHDAGAPLQLAGYPESSWWKFDLPPGWEAWTRQPLEQVCAFQWRSAHTALLDWRAAHPDADVLQLRFEDVVGPARPAVFARVLAWLGVGDHPAFAEVVGGELPVVMATGRPRQRRWFARAALFEQILADPRNRALMERLGYDSDPASWT